jgi:rSAM/selenodomain-associated transferase 1
MRSAPIRAGSPDGMTSAPRRETAIAVFAKAPVAGEVKTRLAAVLGADAAASLHAGLVRHALSTAVQAQVGPVELRCLPDAGHPFFARCREEFVIELAVQRGADLGERMRDAFEARSPLVVIGADCPALTVEHLRRAVAALEAREAVVVPAEDGGYVLLGLARPVPGLFDGVAWGTAAVMTQTRERLAAAKVDCEEFPALWDVDRPEDYARLQRDGLLPEVLS